MKEKKERFSLFKKNRSGSLFGSPIVILMTFILIIAILLIFIIFVDFGKGGYKVEDVDSQIGDNLFVAGLLRSQLVYEGKNVALSEIVSRYCLKKNDTLEKAIKEKINPMMHKMYGKDVCWKMTVPSGTIASGINDCALLSKEEDITAVIFVPGFGEEICEVGFETKK
jgi:hypothetical protein